MKTQFKPSMIELRRVIESGLTQYNNHSIIQVGGERKSAIRSEGYFVTNDRSYGRTNYVNVYKEGVRGFQKVGELKDPRLAYQVSEHLISQPV